MPANKKIKDKRLKIKDSKAKTKVAGSAVKKTAKTGGLIVPVYGLTGKKKGTTTLPKEIFGAKVNPVLMAQAIRVYLVNQRQGTASTKTRGEVNKTTAKWYRQKGTGRARHGAKSAPIFVGGGIAFGPRPRHFELKISKQMRRKALFSALSEKLANNQVFVVDVDAASGKTKEIFNMFKTLNLLGKVKSKMLFVRGEEGEAARAARNIDGLNIEPAQNLNAYEVLNSNSLVFAKDAIAKLI